MTLSNHHGSDGSFTPLEKVFSTFQTVSSLLSSLSHRLASRPEALAFWSLALAQLAPIWAFRYLPTQDGPSHLANALILRDYGNSTAGYETFYELRPEPLPNLSSHLLLMGFLYLFPPLIAEKLLVSLYVLGFAGSFRYFLGAYGPRCQPLSWAGLLLVYQRCFWLGFYNYCLSLILLWLVVGFCLRRRETLNLLDAVMLLLLFTLAYFTHLMGFLLAFAGALGAVVLAPPRRRLAPILVVLAALPAGCLAMAYFEQTRFSHASSAMRVVYQPWAVLRAEGQTIDCGKELAALDLELFAPHAGEAIPFSLVLAGFLILLTLITVACSFIRPAEKNTGSGWLFPAVFGLLLLGVYLLVPNHLGLEHGGFLKTRLALLPPLLWLACLREPAQRAPQLLVRMTTIVLLAVNWGLVAHTVAVGNQELEQYTAGIKAVGRGHRLFALQPAPRPIPLVDPLLHAADYYCLGTDNVNLDNYEASVPHFPVKYRPGVSRARGNWFSYSQQDAVDIVLCWQTPANSPVRGPAGWKELFHEGPLSIYRRPE